MSILDDVIKTIRSSKSKKDACANLINKFDFIHEIQKYLIIIRI